MLLAAMAIICIAVPVIKDVVDRPRPAGGLVDAAGLSYPERPRGALGPLRVAGADGRDPAAAGLGVRHGADRRRAGADRRGRAQPRLPRRALPQRRERRLGAGVAAFAGCAAIALVVSHLRQNHAEEPDADPREDRDRIPAVRRRRADQPARVRGPDPGRPRSARSGAPGRRRRRSSSRSSCSSRCSRSGSRSGSRSSTTGTTSPSSSAAERAAA